MCRFELKRERRPKFIKDLMVQVEEALSKKRLDLDNIDIRAYVLPFGEGEIFEVDIIFCGLGYVQTIETYSKKKYTFTDNYIVVDDLGLEELISYVVERAEGMSSR